MTELSDWVWLGLLLFWVVLRILPRLFRSRAAQEAKPEPAPPAAARNGSWSSPAEMGQERIGDIGPGPIEPK